jgi:hypothetical protein
MAANGEAPGGQTVAANASHFGHSRHFAGPERVAPGYPGPE